MDNLNYKPKALATGLGLEPRSHPPEGWVLPLDDPVMIINRYPYNRTKLRFYQTVV